MHLLNQMFVCLFVWLSGKPENCKRSWAQRHVLHAEREKTANSAPQVPKQCLRGSDSRWSDPHKQLHAWKPAGAEWQLIVVNGAGLCGCHSRRALTHSYGSTHRHQHNKRHTLGCADTHTTGGFMEQGEKVWDLPTYRRLSNWRVWLRAQHFAPVVVN